MTIIKPKNQLAPWEGIQEFVAVVDFNGFTAAAERLGVSASHVSRQVARLEKRLGVKLLVRSTRVVRMTDAGTSYYNQVSGIASAIERANQDVVGANAQLSGNIRISAAGAFAERQIAPLMAKFALQHPKVSVDIDFNTQNVDLLSQAFDFAVRYGVLANSSLVARKLCIRQMVCVASEKYLATHGTPQHPNDLREHLCLRSNQSSWRFVEVDGKTPLDVAIEGIWQSNNGPAVEAACVEGLGIAYMPKENFAKALKDKQLVCLLQQYIDKTRANYLVYPQREFIPLRVQKAMDFLLAQF